MRTALHQLSTMSIDVQGSGVIPGLIDPHGMAPTTRSGILALLVLFALAMPLMAQTEQEFQLDPGEWRWVDFTVKRIPTEVDCTFKVLEGKPTVHVELLPRSEFRLFSRGERHDTLALSPASRGGSFRRIVDERGRYAVVIVNAKNATPAMVSLDLRTDANPNVSVIARELPQTRRVIVILISFLLFLVTATWSAVRLLQAMKIAG
jgi:hypothetical protein